MKQFRKALVAAGGSFVMGLGAALNDGNLTVHELLVVIGAALVLGGGVYKIRNGDA